MTKQRKAKLELGILCAPCTRANFITDKEKDYNVVEAAILSMCRNVLEETASKLYATAERICASSGVEFYIIPPDEIGRMVRKSMMHEPQPTCSSLVEVHEDGTVKRVTPNEAINARLSGKRTDH